MSESRRVMITGLSALTSCGDDLTTTWESILAGSSGISEVTQYDISDWPCSLSAELKDFKPAKMLPDRKLIKVISRQDVMGIHAGVKAVEHSNMISFRDELADATQFNEQTAVYVGSPGNKYCQQYDFLPLLAKTGDDMVAFADQLFEQVHPMWLLRILPNNVLAYTGITYNFKGPNHNITNHAAGGAQAILEAWHAIKSGQADRAVVVGYDMGAEPQAQFYYDKLGVLSHTHLKPFDKAHNGTILGEGAAAIVLESEESARARDAICYGEFVGGATATEGNGLFSIDGNGNKLAALMKQTLTQSGLAPDECGLVVAHGNGNKRSDDTEAQAINQTFADYKPAVTAFKWATGHTLCASGVLDTVLAVQSLHQKTIPGIANFEEAAAEAVGLNISSKSRALEQPAALVINRGFGSMNVCLAVKSCD